MLRRVPSAVLPSAVGACDRRRPVPQFAFNTRLFCGGGTQYHPLSAAVKSCIGLHDIHVKGFGFSEKMASFSPQLSRSRSPRTWASLILLILTPLLLSSLQPLGALGALRPYDETYRHSSTAHTNNSSFSCAHKRAQTRYHTCQSHPTHESRPKLHSGREAISSLPK